MQSQGLFQGQWEIKWSAGSATALLAFMLFSVMSGMWEYVTDSGSFFGLLMAVLTMVSPMVIGMIINWIGCVKKSRPLMFTAGIFYCLNAIFGLPFLLYNIIPAILSFRGFYKLGKKPTLRPPRLG